MRGNAFDVVALYRSVDDPGLWPFEASGPDELRRRLGELGHFLPLPREPAEHRRGSLVDFLIERAGAVADLAVRRGTERGYPDLGSPARFSAAPTTRWT